jgi:6-phosphogluconolactonase (cycloisomerase 2 family)
MRRAAIVSAIVISVVVVGSWAAQRATSPSVGRPVVYAASGAELIRFEVDVDKAALVRRESTMLHAHVQEAAAAPSGNYLYVGTSDGGPTNTPPGGAVPRGSDHRLTAFRIDPVTGALTAHGSPAQLPSRPIHVTTDPTGTHVLAAYNDPSGITVHELRPDGTIGSEVQPSGSLDVGIYGHQVRVAPSNGTVILVTRGNGPTPTKAEDPGALKVFDYSNGRLSNRLSIAPGGGYNFQARHLDFHPTRPWFFLNLERQNKVQVYRLEGDTLNPDALFTKETLADPRNVRAGQTVSSIHVHPNGRFLYLANRAGAVTQGEGARVWAGGENSIAVYSIDQNTGEPTLVEHADTRGFVPRTFALDAGGRLLVVGNQQPMTVRQPEGSVVQVPATITVFRIRDNGTLEFSNTYDVDTSGGRSLWWIGMASIRGTT